MLTGESRSGIVWLIMTIAEEIRTLSTTQRNIRMVSHFVALLPKAEQLDRFADSPYLVELSPEAEDTCVDSILAVRERVAVNSQTSSVPMGIVQRRHRCMKVEEVAYLKCKFRILETTRKHRNYPF